MKGPQFLGVCDGDILGGRLSGVFELNRPASPVYLSLAFISHVGLNKEVGRVGIEPTRGLSLGGF